MWIGGCSSLWEVGISQILVIYAPSFIETYKVCCLLCRAKFCGPIELPGLSGVWFALLKRSTKPG